MRVLISADAEGVTGVTNTTELLFARPHTVSFKAVDAVAAWKGFFATLLLGWSATDEVYG